MSNSRPLVSVVMSGDTLDLVIAESIESVLRQTYSHFELLIVHTGRCEKTSQMIDEWMARDSRLRQLRVEHVHQVMGFGIAEAQGEYIAFIHGKDLWPDQKLEWQLDALQTTGAEVSLGHLQRFWTDNHGETYWGAVSHVPMLPTHYLSQVLMIKSLQMLNMQTALIRKSVALSQEFSAHLACPVSWWDFWLGLASRYKFVHVDRELLFSRDYLPLSSADEIRQTLQDELAVINRHIMPGVAGWYLKHEAKRMRYEHAITRLLELGKPSLALTQFSTAFWESSLFWRVSGWQTFFRTLRRLV